MGNGKWEHGEFPRFGGHEEWILRKTNQRCLKPPDQCCLGQGDMFE